MVGANAGIVGMTKEHLGLALALSVPVFVVITKIDMCPPNVLQENLKLLVRILKSPGCRKVPVTVKTPDDVVVSAVNFVSERSCFFNIYELESSKFRAGRVQFSIQKDEFSTKSSCNNFFPK